MARRSVTRRHKGLEPGINLTPMLDMIFNLLFFFILATKVRDTIGQMDVHLPQAASAQPASEEQLVPSVTVDATGQVFYKDHPVAREELDLELHYLAQKGRSEIDLRADQKANYGRVIEVMDWCKQAGLKSVQLKLERPDERGRLGGASPRP